MFLLMQSLEICRLYELSNVSSKLMKVLLKHYSTLVLAYLKIWWGKIEKRIFF